MFCAPASECEAVRGPRGPSSRVKFTWRALHSHISTWSSGRSTETRMMGGCRMIFNCLRLSWTWENHASKLNQYTRFISCPEGFSKRMAVWLEAVFSSTIKRPWYTGVLWSFLPHKSKAALLQVSVFLWICFFFRYMHSLNASLVSPSRISPPNIPFQYLLLLLAFFFFPHLLSVFVKTQYEWICH